MEYRLSPPAYAFELEAGYGEPCLDSEIAGSSVMGFLARVRLWLSLLFPSLREGSAQAPIYVQRGMRDIRRNSRNLSSEQADGRLAYLTAYYGTILIPRYGYLRFKQWLEESEILYCLEGCGLPRPWFWAVRERFAACQKSWDSQLCCSAPLRPD